MNGETNPTKSGPPGRRSALELLRRIRSRELRPKQITRHERRVCVAYLQLEGYTQEEIAEIFEVHRHTISRDVKALRKEAAHLVDEIDVRSVAGGLVGWAEQIRAKALKEKDFRLAWQVERDLIADLQGLGYLPRVAQQHEVRIGTFVDLVRLTMEEGVQEEIEAEDAAALPPVEEAPCEEASRLETPERIETAEGEDG